MKNFFKFFLNKPTLIGKIVEKIPGKFSKNWPENVKTAAGFAIILLVLLAAFGVINTELMEQLINILEELGRGE
jgi:hypothetical protein